MMIADRDKLKAQLIRHEGLRLKAYQDTVGVTTIGVGRNLDHVGISEEEAEFLLEHDIARSELDCLSAFPWFDALDPLRQRVWIDLCFNMGISRLKGFTKAIAAMAANDFGSAAVELENSKWAKQVGTRADWLIRALITGRDPEDAS